MGLGEGPGLRRHPVGPLGAAFALPISFLGSFLFASPSKPVPGARFPLPFILCPTFTDTERSLLQPTEVKAAPGVSCRERGRGVEKQSLLQLGESGHSFLGDGAFCVETQIRVPSLIFMFFFFFSSLHSICIFASHTISPSIIRYWPNWTFFMSPVCYLC